MPSSETRSTADLDEYRAAIRNPSVELTVTARGQFNANITRIDLHRLWLQRGKESLPRIWRAEPRPERSIISILTEPGQCAVRNGVEFRACDIALHSPDHAYQHRSSGSLCWGGMSLPVADMAEIGAHVAGRDLMPQRDEQIVTPPAPAMARLQRLHATAGHLAEHAPEIISQPDAARGLEQTLVEALVDCLVEPDRCEDAAARRRHVLIMQRFYAALEASEDSAVYRWSFAQRLACPAGPSGCAARNIRG